MKKLSIIHNGSPKAAHIEQLARSVASASFDCGVIIVGPLERTSASNHLSGGQVGRMAAVSAGAGKAAASFVAFGTTADLSDQAVFTAALRRFFGDVRVAGTATEFAAMVERTWPKCERAKQIATQMRNPDPEGAKIISAEGR